MNRQASIRSAGTVEYPPEYTVWIVVPGGTNVPNWNRTCPVSGSYCSVGTCTVWVPEKDRSNTRLVICPAQYSGYRGGYSRTQKWRVSSVEPSDWARENPSWLVGSSGM